MRDRLAADDRGVSGVVGFILIFAILVILLSTYQAVWVPVQNEQVEYDHYQTVKDDMTNVRSAIFEARTTGEAQSTTVKLGTRYPTRGLAINPPPATGQLKVGERRSVSMVYQDGTAIDIPTRFPGITSDTEVYTKLLRYSPNYRELDTGAPIRHEHGLLYMNYSETEQGGGLVIHNAEQTLVQTSESGVNEVTIVPIQGNYSKLGVERVSVDPEPGILTSREFEDINVTVPTDLDEPTWEEILSDDLAPENVVVDESAGELTLVLDGVWAVEYAPIGVDGTPASGARGTEQNDINPASPGDIRLSSSERLEGQNAWLTTFNNTGATTKFTEARVSFYASFKGDTTTLESIEFPDGSNQDLLNLNWRIGDPFAALEPPIRMEGDNTETQLLFNFNDVHNQDTFFVVEFIFENGERGTYFVGDNPDTTNNNPGGGGDAGNSGTGPVVTTLDAQAVSIPGNTDEVTIDWAVEEQGDSELTQVILQVSGDANDNQVIPVSGQSASGTETYTTTNNPSGTVSLVVRNADGQQASAGDTY